MSAHSEPTTRREFLSGLGAVTVGGAVATGTVAASHLRSQPSHVKLEYDTDDLDQYRPAFVSGHLDVEPTGLYGLVARSTQHRTFCCEYWMQYPYQRGYTRYDSHYGDHEPLYVFVDAESGDIEEVVYTAYHWLAGRTQAAPTRDQHPLFRIAHRYHHYQQYPDARSSDTTEYEVADLVDRFPHWLENDMEEEMVVGGITDPWLLASVDGGRGRDHWWQDDAGGLFSVEATKWRQMLDLSQYIPFFDYKGADSSDLT